MGRFTLIVLDSFGVGEMPDAKEFGDEGSNTLLSIVNAVGHLKVPHMAGMGLYNIDGLPLEKVQCPGGAFGKAAEKCHAKDTTSGHFEIAGLIMEKPYVLYPGGRFPDRVISAIERKIKRKLIGNYPASGTEIIKVLGDEHVKTGSPIVYSSADSILQLAMHESVIPLSEQYEICRTAREIMRGDDTVGRVICRPFTGSGGHYVRTENRKDFAVDPPGRTVLDALKDAGREVIGVGKIEDIFNRVGLTRIDHTKNNAQGIESTKKFLDTDFDGLLFVNLVDFDMLYGHRNDPVGYAKALEYFDSFLPEIFGRLKDDDLLLITADHGCDPVTPSTDHSREYTPLLVWGPKVKKNVNLHARSSFSDIAATIAQYFSIAFPVGESFLDKLF